MAEIDPELRDKIIETHTLLQTVVKSHDEHKLIVNARLREAKREFNEHKKDVKVTFEKHDIRIEKSETFRTKVLTYAGMMAVGGAVVIEILVAGGKKVIGL